MTDSSSFSSLLALVDSHLSKTTIQESRSEDGNGVSTRFPLPSFSGGQLGTCSDTRLAFAPGQKLPLPAFPLKDSPIQSILAEQVANMLKAKELKRQEEEEKQRLIEEMKRIKIEEDNDVIDLMKALQEGCPSRPKVISATPSHSSSFESLFEPNFIDCDGTVDVEKPYEPLLPCKTDMSYILKQKVRKGKVSAFGRVLCSRMRPVGTPYLKVNIESPIVRFDFSTPSPCDIIKEKRRQPTCSTPFVPDIINFF